MSSGGVEREMRMRVHLMWMRTGAVAMAACVGGLATRHVGMG